MEPADAMTVPDTFAWGCDTFWGSHGCILGAAPHDVHLCAVTTRGHGEGEGTRDRCSQCVKIGPLIDHSDGYGAAGHAKVRFWYHHTDKPGEWSDWDEHWTWFN